MFGFAPSVMQSKQRTCWVWKLEFLETRVLIVGLLKWLCFTLYFTTVAHGQRVQKDIEDMQSALGIFNLELFIHLVLFQPQQMFIFC